MQKGGGLTFLAKRVDLLLSGGEAGTVSALFDVGGQHFTVLVRVEFLNGGLCGELRLERIVSNL